MHHDSFQTICATWQAEMRVMLDISPSLYVAEFFFDGILLNANASMRALFSDSPVDSLLNPTFAQLLDLQASPPKPVYNGFLTVGDPINRFTSLQVLVFRQAGRLLIVGGVDARLLMEENTSMSHLNNEISNLQRQLIKEKVTLEATYQQLHQANANLKEANATKDRFFSIMAQQHGYGVHRARSR